VIPKRLRSHASAHARTCALTYVHMCARVIYACNARKLQKLTKVKITALQSVITIPGKSSGCLR